MNTSSRKSAFPKRKLIALETPAAPVRSPKSKSARTAAEKPACSPKSEAAVAEAFDPFAMPELGEAQALQQALALVINCVPKITRGVIGEAVQGSYLHARMLFDFVGISAAPAPAAAGGLSPIMAYLAQELGLDPALLSAPASAAHASDVYTKKPEGL